MAAHEIFSSCSNWGKFINLGRVAGLDGKGFTPLSRGSVVIFF
jgi:hypothetical protein